MLHPLKLASAKTDSGRTRLPCRGGEHTTGATWMVEGLVAGEGAEVPFSGYPASMDAWLIVSAFLQLISKKKRRNRSKFSKADAGLELNVSKTSILPKGVTAQAAFEMARTIMQATPTLTYFTNEVLLDSFCPEGLIAIGVSIGTDAFVRSFMTKTCRDIIDDVEKLDAIQDGFIHYQLLRFCQTTRLQYINSHIMFPNHCVLQQQHVDCKIADELLKKGTKQHADVWDSSSKDWAYMCIHLPHEEVGFGVTFNDVTKDSVFYTTTSRFVT